MASVFVWPFFFFSLFLSSAAVGLMLNTRNVDTTVEIGVRSQGV